MSNTKRLVCLVFCLALLLGGFSLPVWAQNVGSMRGTVVDKTGAAVLDATVTVTDLATNSSRNTKTNNAGEFSVAQLNPGDYRVEIAKDGFKKYIEAKVTILVATPTSLDIQLELGTITQQVIIESAAAPALNTEDATVGNPFAEDEVKSLPFLARNVVNLLTLQPGVVTTGTSDTDKLAMGSTSTLDRRDGAVDGVRGNQTNITVDGVDANDWQNQAAFTSALPITLDSVQEFRVTTTNANATDGIVGGAQVALVTKSGTNDFHGNLRWYYRTSGASSNDFFNKIPPGIARGKDQRNIGGGSLGGRIFLAGASAARSRESAPTSSLTTRIAANRWQRLLQLATSQPRPCGMASWSISAKTRLHARPARCRAKAVRPTRLRRATLVCHRLRPAQVPRCRAWTLLGWASIRR